jgi:prepilin-type N-terminal cleavage/methylation domain-containing protein
MSTCHSKSLNLHSHLNNQAGFTLIELMVTVVLLAIIAAIAVPIYLGYKKEAQTQEAWLQLTNIADLCATKAIKAIETNSPAALISVEPLTSGSFFNYDAAPVCTVAGGTFTATGHSGSVIGKTLTVTVTLSGTTVSKTWGGDLF